MRLKFRGDTFYLPTPEGVYLRNNRDTFFIKEKAVYRWLELLVPYLDGHTTLEEITADFPPERKAAVDNIMHALLNIAVVKDTTGDQPHTLTQTEEELYTAEIAFIDAFCDSAAYRFEQFRKSRILLIGSGFTFTSLVHATLQSGVREIAVVATDECPSDQHYHRAPLHTFRPHDPRQRLTDISIAQWDDEAEIRTALSPFNIVIHVSDQPMLARARMLNTICLMQKKVFIQAAIVDDRAWIGPLVHPSSAIWNGSEYTFESGSEYTQGSSEHRRAMSGCWECAWRRLQASRDVVSPQLSHYAFQDFLTAPLSRFIAQPTAATLANHLCFEIFKYTTGIDQLETVDCLLDLDLETLESHKHSFYPYPLCSACQHPTVLTEESFLDTVQQLEQGKPLDQATFLKRVADCFEHHLGPFSPPDEHDFIQVPLHVSQVTVSHPLAVTHPQKTITAIGAGPDVSTARQRATQRACEIYAASMVDQRRCTHLTAEQYEQKKCQVHEFWSSPTLDETREWIWAYALDTGQAHLIPATLVYPTLCGQMPSRETAPGPGSGMSWAEAVCRALLAQCKHMTVIHIDTCDEIYAQVDGTALASEMALSTAEPFPTTASVSRYRRILELSDTTVTVYDVTGPLGIPTFAFCLGTTTITYSSHIDPLQALQDGYEEVVLYNQALMNKQPQYTPPAVPDLPQARRGTRLVVPSANNESQDWPDRQQRLLQALHQHCLQALAVPLNHDPILTDVLPYIVSIVLARSPLNAGNHQ